MTSECLDTSRELPDLPPQRLAGPVLLSIALHVVVLLAFARAVFSPAEQESPLESPVERPNIRVALAMRAPPIAQETLEPEVTESIAPEALEVPEDVAEDTAGEVAEESVAATPAAEATSGVALSESAPAEPIEDQGRASAVTIQPWTPARIRAAVQDSGSQLRSQFTSEWMEGCIRERKASGTPDCDRQLQQQEALSANAAAGRAAAVGAFANVTRGDRQWLLAEQFRKSNDTLRDLADADGLVGELASARYYLNRDYIIYLSGNRVNGNHNDMVFHAMQNFTADALGGPRLTVNGNTPFQCGGKKLEYEANLAAPRVTYGGVVPCIYEFTGFDIEQPEAEPDPDAFRVVPPVFGRQR